MIWVKRGGDTVAWLSYEQLASENCDAIFWVIFNVAVQICQVQLVRTEAPDAISPYVVELEMGVNVWRDGRFHRGAVN